MKRWTDKIIQRQVEEVIEESYLLCLSNTEIQQNMRIFIESCEQILHDKLHEEIDMKTDQIRGAFFKARLLLNIGSHSLNKIAEDTDSLEKTPHDFLAEQVVETKSLILGLIEEYDHQLNDEVMKIFREKEILRQKYHMRRVGLRSFFYHTGYFALLALTGLILWIVLFH